jgi:hypothetical protein
MNRYAHEPKKQEEYSQAEPRRKPSLFVVKLSIAGGRPGPLAKGWQKWHPFYRTELPRRFLGGELSGGYDGGEDRDAESGG